DEDWNNWEYEQLGVICVDLKHLAWILDNLLHRQMVVCKQTTYVSYGLYEDGAYYNGMRVFQLLQMDTMLMTKYSGGKERTEHEYLSMFKGASKNYERWPPYMQGSRGF
ncbi:hypothetical protein Tco_1158116, partial [Tanacetum coccineum]